MNEKVKSGLYNSASEVGRKELRLLHGPGHLRAMKLEALRQDIQAGLRSGKAFPLDMESIKTTARKRYVKRNKS